MARNSYFLRIVFIEGDMKKGLEVTFTNGDKDWYDPVEYESGIKEGKDIYTIDNGYCFYLVDKNAVKSLRWYDLCPKCGSELYSDGCHIYGCE